ncbi:hypothetical protein BU16DRAFT_568130 [Lophium mytilinum]|uniref:Uncharacterized protein n=1 Tax=Lophium mytilinum TaxID=390894 RepID=A0A6A6QAW8_9PEZI|nr:hypothetical protein BU16DRAFT_568130 [Lophium mytilinum]
MVSRTVKGPLTLQLIRKFVLKLTTNQPGKPKPTKRTVSDYIGDMKTPKFYWNKGDWSQCHGDNKGTTGGNYTTETMISSTTPEKYLVRVCQLKKPIVKFEMPALDHDGIPTNEEVLKELQVQIP